MAAALAEVGWKIRGVLGRSATATEVADAGVDVDLGSGILIGLKLSYNRTGDIGGSHGYSEHKVPDLTSYTRISEIERWSLLVGAKYLLDGN